MALVGKCCDEATHEGGAGGHFGGRVEFDVDELGHAVDGQKHVRLALSGAELGTVDVDVADFGFLERLAF